MGKERTACTPVAIDTSCYNATAVSSDRDFKFAFLDCLTPRVDQISVGEEKTEKTSKVLEGSGTAVISVSGSGFGSDSLCQNSMEFGYNGQTAKCEATSMGASAFDCRISANDLLLPEREHTLSLRVGNKGTAGMATNSTI